MKDGFIREVYLRSTPSIDLNLVPEGEKVDCGKHTILMSEYNKLVEEYCENEDEKMGAAFFMLNSGPLLIDDTIKKG